MIGYYFLALLAAGVFHELGHGLAAAAEDVAILGSGLVLVGIYPGGFVDLHTRDLQGALPRIRQLRIFTAGAWHNIVLSVCVPYFVVAKRG